MKVGGSTAFTKLSTFFDDAELKRAVETADVTAFQATDRSHVPGLRTGEVSLSGHFDSTIWGTLAGQLAASTNPSFRYGPEDNTTGRRRYNFDGIITSLNTKGNVGSKVDGSMTILISGAVTSTSWTSTD